MNIDDLTIKQARELAGMFRNTISDAQAPSSSQEHAVTPVIVCTDKRGVVFGYTSNVGARPISLVHARMCLYWSSDVGGVFGLAETGPTRNCKISAVVPTISLVGVTAIMSMDDKAVSAWTKAPVQGRT